MKKKLKFVKTFESFKVNEEVPYNYSVGNEMTTVRWTEQEKSDLESLGADTIGKSDATFVENGGLLNVEVSKHRPENGKNIYRAKSDMSRKRNFNTTSANDWESFLRELNKFMKSGGEIENPLYDPRNYGMH
jgi:hypothetical protein